MRFDSKENSVTGTISGTVLDENQAALIDDERFIHYARNIETTEGDVGYRDIWMIEINQWKNRAYGSSLERVSMA